MHKVLKTFTSRMICVFWFHCVIFCSQDNQGGDPPLRPAAEGTRAAWHDHAWQPFTAAGQGYKEEYLCHHPIFTSTSAMSIMLWLGLMDMECVHVCVYICLIFFSFSSHRCVYGTCVCFAKIFHFLFHICFLLHFLSSDLSLNHLSKSCGSNFHAKLFFVHFI